MNLIELDRNLFLFINSFAGKNVWFDSLAKLLVNEFFVPTALSLVLFGFWFYWDKADRDTKQKSVLVGVLSVGLGSLIIVSLINNLIYRLRPFETLEVNLLFYKPTDPSFPSNATVVAFSIAAAIFTANKKLGYLALIVAGFYGFLRIFVGIHFPADVFVGALIGVVSVLIINSFDKLLTRSVIFLRSFLRTINLGEFS